MPDPVMYHTADQICTVTLNRPQQRNALSLALLDALDAALKRADTDSEVRAVVLTGAGSVFCAGGDLGEIAAAQDDVTSTYGYLTRYARFFETAEGLGKPLVAAVNGHALGGGLGLVLGCDLALAVEGATFGTPEVSVGIFPAMVLGALFQHVGRKAGMELILSGQRVDAQRALQLGMLNRVVAAPELEREVWALAAQLAQWPPEVLRLGRRAFYAAQDMDSGAALEYLKAMAALNLLSEETRSGVRGFLAGRD